MQSYLHPWLNSKDPYTPDLNDHWMVEYVKAGTPPAKKAPSRISGLEDDPFVPIYKEILYIKDKRDF